MDELNTLVLRVRADTSGLAQDVGNMRALLEGPLVESAQAVGRVMDGAMRKLLTTGKIGLEDMKRLALSALDEMARAQMSSLTGGKGVGGALMSLFQNMIMAGRGAPGRATGGLVSPQRPYMVGERGPELFVPTSSGHIVPNHNQTARNIAITVNVQTGESNSPEILRRSGRQTALAVARAMERSRW